MVILAAELFEAELVILNYKKPSFSNKLEAIFMRRQKQRAGESLLLICPSPECLLALINIKGWRNRFKYTSAWVIDSFWLEWIPRPMRSSLLFDRFFVTTEEDIDWWSQLTKTPTAWLPWGADVLRLGGKDPERVWDLTRIGRQPSGWDNDANTERLCSERNFRFHGRPAFYDDPIENQKTLTSLYRQTKFSLAFSNTANPTKYTHPTREYLTARWVDALACGATLAGIPPNEPSINKLLWDGATLNLGTTRVEEGMQILSEAVSAWKPESAERNYCQALARLDWRWRFKTIADLADEPCKRLDDELQLLVQERDRSSGNATTPCSQDGCGPSSRNSSFIHGC